MIALAADGVRISTRPSGDDEHVFGPARRHAAAWAARAAELSIRYAGTPEQAAVELACRQAFVLAHGQAHECGVDRAKLRQLVRRDEWTTISRGVVAPVTSAEGNSADLRAAAAVLVHPGMVVSHESGAALHGLPLLADPVRPVLTAARVQSACNWPHVVVRVAALPAAARTSIFGAPTTSIAWTVADLSRHSVRAGLVAADDALREGLMTLAQLAGAIDDQRGWPGVRSARIVAGLATSRAESPLESLTRLFLHRCDVPLPVPQVWITAFGYRTRVDGLWPERAVVLEIDGMLKYSDASALHREKLRQEALERAGFIVVRVTWSDIHERPLETLARIARALRAGGNERLRVPHL